MKRNGPAVPQFFATLAQEFPKTPAHFVARIGLELMALARKQGNISVKLCNGDMDQDAYDRKHAVNRKRIGAHLAELEGAGKTETGIEFQTGGDPRGAALKLRLPSGSSNDWGGEGFYCVPEGK